MSEWDYNNFLHYFIHNIFIVIHVVYFMNLQSINDDFSGYYFTLFNLDSWSILVTLVNTFIIIVQVIVTCQC